MLTELAGRDPIVSGLTRGDDRAAAEAHERFVRRLIVLASRRLGSLYRGQADRDPEDVVQSAFRSFFVRCGRGEIILGDWDDVWRLLVVITLRKCGQRRDYLRAARRDVRRTRFARRPGRVADARAAAIEPTAGDPPPEVVAILAETAAGWLDGLAPEVREVIELGLRGHGPGEIAGRLKRSERTVRRLRQYAEGSLIDRIRSGEA
jgi:RNA polymerase sigma-70 factor (ECF subfamily)